MAAMSEKVDFEHFQITHPADPEAKIIPFGIPKFDKNGEGHWHDDGSSCAGPLEECKKLNEIS